MSIICILVVKNHIHSNESNRILRFLFIFVCFFILQISLGFGYNFIDLLHCVQAQVSLKVSFSVGIF